MEEADVIALREYRTRTRNHENLTAAELIDFQDLIARAGIYST
jgi:hypothetical protein